MGAVHEVFEKAKADLEPLAAQYASLINDFSAYRATEAAETEGYEKLAADASKAPLNELDAIEPAVLTAALGASAKPKDLLSAAIKLAAQIQLRGHIAGGDRATRIHDDARRGAPDDSSAMRLQCDARLCSGVSHGDATATALIMGVGMQKGASAGRARRSGSWRTRGSRRRRPCSPNPRRRA
jgi:hypothetical protein